MENINRSKSTYTVACLPVYGVLCTLKASTDATENKLD